MPTVAAPSPSRPSSSQRWTKRASVTRRGDVVAPGEGSKSYRGLSRRSATGVLVARAGAWRPAWWRSAAASSVTSRASQPRRLKRGMTLGAAADEPSGSGRFVGRRQDRHQRPSGQEPRRRLPSAERSSSPIPTALDTLSPREFGARAMPKSPNTASSTTPPFFAWLERAPCDEVLRRGGQRCRSAKPLPSRSRAGPRPPIVAARRVRAGRPGAVEPRAYLRPCPGADHGHYDGARLVHGEGGRHRPRAWPSASRRSSRPRAGPQEASRVAHHLARGRPAHPDSRDIPGWNGGAGPGAEAMLDAIDAGQEGHAHGRLNLHPRARHRPRASCRVRTSITADVRWRSSTAEIGKAPEPMHGAGRPRRRALLAEFWLDLADRDRLYH